MSFTDEEREALAPVVAQMGDVVCQIIEDDRVTPGMYYILDREYCERVGLLPPAHETPEAAPVRRDLPVVVLRTGEIPDKERANTLADAVVRWKKTVG